MSRSCFPHLCTMLEGSTVAFAIHVPVQSRSLQCESLHACFCHFYVRLHTTSVALQVVGSRIGVGRAAQLNDPYRFPIAQRKGIPTPRLSRLLFSPFVAFCTAAIGPNSCSRIISGRAHRHCRAQKHNMVNFMESRFLVIKT